MNRSGAASREIELARLLQGCAARDARALHALYDEAAPLLFAKLLRILRRSPVAEEVLRDVFLHVWERAGSFEAHRGHALAWLSTLTRYLAIDRLGHERVIADELPYEMPTLEVIEEHIAALDEVTRQCLALAYVDGRSYEEIADITDSPRGVRQRIRRGLLQLRDETPVAEHGRPARKTANRELLDRLAAEYALGTLRGRARRRFARWLLSPRVAGLVRTWEDRLEFLEAREASIAPPPANVWSDIETRLELRRLARHPARRWIGIAASVVVFTLLAAFLIA
jgi:RNA polymerase sigma-70 factor (ECF subfamily)